MANSRESCPHCGEQLDPGVRFCGKCGKPVTANGAGPGTGAGQAPSEASPGSLAAKRTMVAFQIPGGLAGAQPASAGAQPAQRPGTETSPEESGPAVGPQSASQVGAAEPDGSDASGPAAKRPEPSAPQTTASVPERQLARGKTMLGIPAQGLVPPGAVTAQMPGYGQPAAGQQPEQPSRPSTGQPPGASAAAPAVEAERGVAPGSAPVPDAKKPLTQKTMIGMPAANLGIGEAGGAPPLKPAAAKPAESAESAHAEAEAKGPATMPAAVPPPKKTISDPAPPEAPPEPQPRTMLGVPSPATHEQMPTKPDSGVEPAADSAAGKPGLLPETGRTMLGVAGPAQDTAAKPAAPRQATAAAPATAEPPATAAKKRSSAAPTMVLLALLIAAAAAAGVFFIKGADSKVRATVVKTEAGEEMLFEVPGAPADSKIRFGGQEKPLVAGRATFRLAGDSLRVGENAVLVDLVYPDGRTEPASITLTVQYRIRVDSSPLQTERPAVDVVVNALPGSSVTLDGAELKLDANGTGVKRYPITAADAPTSGVIEHVVRYRVQPPSGEAEVDELRTKIPIATMQIDRPGPEAVTDKEAIEIAGAVAPNAEVTVNGEPVPVKAGRFLYRLSLPAPGSFKPKVLAREPGRAPHLRALKIRRVVDLAKEAEGFQADPNLTYARIAQNPSIYKGQKVALEGRVYNVNVHGGRSVLQLLVRKCPKGARCSLWVTYSSATDAVVNSWVRVLGAVEGQQQFRSEKGQVVTVPKVAATYLLPAKP